MIANRRSQIDAVVDLAAFFASVSISDFGAVRTGSAHVSFIKIEAAGRAKESGSFFFYQLTAMTEIFEKVLNEGAVTFWFAKTILLACSGRGGKQKMIRTGFDLLEGRAYRMNIAFHDRLG